MSQPYVGECRLVGFSFAPAGWNFCNGALVPISQYDTLFNLIGTTYGGDGQQTFGLPDLQGRVPVHQGNGFVIGQKAGVESVTLNVNQIPSHGHATFASSLPGGSSLVQNNLLAGSGSVKPYVNVGTVTGSMNAGTIGMTGNSQPHDNMQPYLAMNWIISFFGVYPSPS